jgi:hypothetical protein
LAVHDTLQDFSATSSVVQDVEREDEPELTPLAAVELTPQDVRRRRLRARVKSVYHYRVKDGTCRCAIILQIFFIIDGKDRLRAFPTSIFVSDPHRNHVSASLGKAVIPVSARPQVPLAEGSHQARRDIMSHTQKAEDAPIFAIDKSIPDQEWVGLLEKDVDRKISKMPDVGISAAGTSVQLANVGSQREQYRETVKIKLESQQATVSGGHLNTGVEW